MTRITVLALAPLLFGACNKSDSGPAAPDDGQAVDFDDDGSDAESDAVDAAASAEDAAGEPIRVTLHNLCDKPQNWVVIDGDVTPDPSAGQELAPGATAEVELEPEQFIARKDEAGQWSGRARANADGGHVWMSSTCQGVSSSDDPNADPAALDAERQKQLKAASGG